MSIKKVFSSLFIRKSHIPENKIEISSVDDSKLEEESDAPEIVRRFRKSYSNKNDIVLVNLYFELLNKMRDDAKSKNFDSMRANGQISLGLVESLIRDCKNSYGSFDIKTIPVIDWVLPHLAVKGNIGQLRNIKDVVDYFPELSKWKEEVDKAFELQKLASKIYSYLKDNPETLQKDLKKFIDYPDGKLIANVVHYMEVQGKIKRSKIGKLVSWLYNYET